MEVNASGIWNNCNPDLHITLTSPRDTASFNLQGVHAWVNTISVFSILILGKKKYRRVNTISSFSILILGKKKRIQKDMRPNMSHNIRNIWGQDKCTRWCTRLRHYECMFGARQVHNLQIQNSSQREGDQAPDVAHDQDYVKTHLTERHINCSLCHTKELSLHLVDFVSLGTCLLRPT